MFQQYLWWLVMASQCVRILFWTTTLFPISWVLSNNKYGSNIHLLPSQWKLSGGLLAAVKTVSSINFFYFFILNLLSKVLPSRCASALSWNHIERARVYGKPRFCFSYENGTWMVLNIFITILKKHKQ